MLLSPLLSDTSHAKAAADIILDDVNDIKDHKDWKVTCPDEEPPEINDKDWAHTFEAFDKWLCGCLGESSKIPLAYVVHDNEAVTLDPVAPTTWPSKIDEMIQHAPHGMATLLGDNVKVWERISALTCSHECWTYGFPVQCTHNGRLAYLNLKHHYLWPNNMDHQVNGAKTKLKDTTYHSEQHNWTFKVCLYSKYSLGRLSPSWLCQYQ